MLTGLPKSGGTMAPLAPLTPAALPRDLSADPRVAEVWLFLFRVSVFHVHPNRKKKENYKKYKKYQIKLKLIKFIYSEKATKFCKIFTLLLPYVVPVKSKVKISQSFVAFSEYMNFKKELSFSKSNSKYVANP
jgi:hypothetical protein